MNEESRIIRGAPRYIRGAAAGPAGVITLIPEAVVSADGRTVEPVAVVELLPDGVRRHPIALPTRNGMGQPALIAVLAPLLATLLDRWWQARHSPGIRE
jgi:hypothetical protein